MEIKINFCTFAVLSPIGIGQGHIMIITKLEHKIKTDSYLRTHIVFIIDTFVSVCASLIVIFLLPLINPDIVFGRQFTLTWILGSLGASAIAFLAGRAYRAIIRYSTLREIGKLSIVTLAKEFLLWISILAFTNYSSRNTLLLAMVFIDLAVTVLALQMIRVAMITFYDIVRSRTREESNIKRVLIYGIGDKSVAMISRLRNSRNYSVVGFIVYGKHLRGHSIGTLDVYYFEKNDDLQKIKFKSVIDGILFPNAADARSEQNRLIAFCRDYDLKTYLTPGIDEMEQYQPVGNLVRKIKIEDLLGRTEIKINMEEIVGNFSGKIVMVTGAAGSIGSELCRQLATVGVERLILFDNAETPLHNIRLELEDRFPELDFVPVIGDVRSVPRLDMLFRRYKPQVVFHAAAYKHVPLMEENPCEAVHVNVIGSRQVADKCVEYGVEKMVMVSTDKAVNPTNIMGCTKRLAEIYVQSLGLAIEKGDIKGSTKFVTTRFGNVLGSNGSVIPRFREQIEHGGPITVTHPEITRFFMTIPEACRLVMEAATFATGTQIFVFDMGQSVKIADLAKRMISLAGLELGRDITIEYTGLRPGEKLYEEVLASMENTIPTNHDRIFVAKVRDYRYDDAADAIDRMGNLATDVIIPDLVKLMKQVVPEFKSRNSEFEIFDH